MLRSRLEIKRALMVAATSAGCMLTADIAAADAICPGIPDGTVAFAMNSQNQFFRLDQDAGPSILRNPFTVGGAIGNLIGIDFRPGDPDDSLPYAVSDNGNMFRFDLFPFIQTGFFPDPDAPLMIPSSRGVFVSALTVPFAGGANSLYDFNPVVDAARLAGTNDQNFAVVNANGRVLSQTVVQGTFRYAAGDEAAGLDPNITAGAYDNNVAGAQRTTFYMLDHVRNTLVTIADRTATGSSNTGGGMLKTIGRLVDSRGLPIDVQALAGLDIFTTQAGRNVGVAVNGEDVLCIDLGAVNADLPVGTTRNVTATPGLASFAGIASGGLQDIAIPSRGVVNAEVSVTIDGPNLVTSAANFPPTFTVTIRNDGPSLATNIIIAPTGLQPALSLGAPPQNLRTDSGTCNVFAEFGCSLNPLPAGSSATVTFELGVRFLPARRNGVLITEDTLITKVNAFSTVPDSNLVNNSAVKVTTLRSN